MASNEEIGARVKSALGDRPQSWLGDQIGLTKDSMSRSLNGHRGFSSVELARIADVLDADIQELITGRPDPRRLVVAARHEFDPETRERSTPGRDADDKQLESVALAYRQAYPQGVGQSVSVPSDPKQIRDALGPGFARHFADRIEDVFDIDVVRLQGLSTAYSFTQGGKRVIVLPTTANWWYSNFSLAHEIAHLALGHHDVSSTDDNDAREGAANQFASELLLPDEVVRAVDWQHDDGSATSQLLWDSGVGTRTLMLRIEKLRLPVSASVAGILVGRMPGVMRPFQSSMQLEQTSDRVAGDAFDERMRASSQRRFPLSLVTAHRARIEREGLNPGSLAWMLESPVEDVLADDAIPEAGMDLDEVFGA